MGVVHRGPPSAQRGHEATTELTGQGIMFLGENQEYACVYDWESTGLRCSRQCSGGAGLRRRRRGSHYRQRIARARDRCPARLASRWRWLVSCARAGAAQAIESEAEQHIRALIVGWGVIGTSIAYYLAARGHRAEGDRLRRIGQIGRVLGDGLVRRDPSYADLARRSFALHAELAEGRASEWGYRRMTAYGGSVDPRSSSAPRGAGPGWVSTNVSINGQLGSTAPQHRCNLLPLRPG